MWYCNLEDYTISFMICSFKKGKKKKVSRYIAIEKVEIQVRYT